MPARTSTTCGVFSPVPVTSTTTRSLSPRAAAGAIGESDRVVALVTGTGLKTPQVVEVRGGTEIAADVDELLAELGVTV